MKSTTDTSETLTLPYNTRDGQGNDIKKSVTFTRPPLKSHEFECEFCNEHFTAGMPLSDAVSDSFCDYNHSGGSGWICGDCALRMNLYRYSFIEDRDGLRLLNIREMADEIVKPQKPPFKIVISKSQKKHLFYKAITNYDCEKITVNLEEEQITTERETLAWYMRFISAMITLGESKQAMTEGRVSFGIISKTNGVAYETLATALNGRTIQIPLFLAQKAQINESEALCIVSTPRT